METATAETISTQDIYDLMGKKGTANSNEAEPKPGNDAFSGPDQTANPNPDQADNFDDFLFQGGEVKNEEPQPEKDPLADPSSRSQKTAKVVVKSVDFFASAALQIYADTPTKDPFKLDKSEESELISAVADYVEDQQISMPAWLTLAIVFGVIYWGKFIMARALKKTRKKGENPSFDASQAESPANDEPPTYEAEEISDDELDFSLEISNLNAQAKDAGLPELQKDTPCPLGMCKYNWFVEGLKAPTGSGQFENTSAQSRWGNLMGRYKRAGIDIQFLVDAAW